ncbi:MAG: hypothetical protein K2X03_01440 [Bryobacteraceae bacterium]|nr:hypothetical protein [Bryobacteraceae bacterium]
MENEEDVFIRKALAGVEQAERYGRIKEIVATVVALGGVIWLTERSPGRELRLEPVLMGVGLIAAVCTAKLKRVINQNTKTMLQAISRIPSKQS